MNEQARLSQDAPCIGLFGSYDGDWREQARSQLAKVGIATMDPNDQAWDGIHHGNGDAKQDLIDDLVAQQHQMISRSTCVVYHLGAFDGRGQPLPAHAARCELGFLTGSGKATFAYIHPQVLGRNYLWAQMKPYGHMHRSDSLEAACDAAIAFVQEQHSKS